MTLAPAKWLDHDPTKGLLKTFDLTGLINIGLDPYKESYDLNP